MYCLGCLTVEQWSASLWNRLFVSGVILFVTDFPTIMALCQTMLYLFNNCVKEICELINETIVFVQSLRNENLEFQQKIFSKHENWLLWTNRFYYKNSLTDFCMKAHFV